MTAPIPIPAIGIADPPTPTAVPTADSPPGLASERQAVRSSSLGGGDTLNTKSAKSRTPRGTLVEGLSAGTVAQPAIINASTVAFLIIARLLPQAPTVQHCSRAVSYRDRSIGRVRREPPYPSLPRRWQDRGRGPTS